MKDITGLARNQMFFSSLEGTILSDNPVRFIDASANSIHLENIDFILDY